ncbi:MAG: sulfide/dihydroorotate dehydrogenase-like FAD/NAD-binding protein [candidate division WOR-3 bacterium]|uniref:Sulfide/dihydroorotate dehydrogenase-like FAD/NAD-binding protein n=1 Tax=candidate division WOR-3 bacterium TaxID=2052148 RepID=A0A7C4W8S6_UNCW3
MAKILKKEILAPNIKKFIVEVPEIAKKAQPGQFVIIRIDEKGERIPLTIGDFDREKGTVTIVFQEVGKTTYQLGLLKEGDDILDFVGPLGRPSEIEKFGTVCCIGGGVGTPEIYPVARALKKVGNYVISIIGARTKELVIMEKEMKEVSDELCITTDDGTYGMKGLVTDALKKILDTGKKIDRVIAVGPVIMMKAVSELTKNYNIKTIVSLNAMMLDGTGMCGICRVEIGGETKFACVDGPEFDGHLVNYDLLMARLKTYLEEEKISLKLFKEKMGIQ